MRYADFAEEVVRLLDQGLVGSGPEFNNP